MKKTSILLFNQIITYSNKTKKFMKPIVIIVSRQFQTKHPRKGQPTDFADKIRNAIAVMNKRKQLSNNEPPTALKLHTLRGDLQKWTKYFELINAGTHYLSIRVWAGRPRQSAQVEVLRLTKDNMIGLQRLDFVFDKTGKSFTVMVDRKVIPVDKLANNDGLSLNDWLAWMKDEDLTQPMAVVQFTSFRY